MNKQKQVIFSITIVIVQVIITLIKYRNYIKWEESLDGGLKGLISYRFSGWILLFFIITIVIYELVNGNLLIKKTLKKLLLILIGGQIVTFFFNPFGIYDAIYNTAWFVSYLVIFVFIIQTIIKLFKGKLFQKLK